MGPGRQWICSWWGHSCHDPQAAQSSATVWRSDPSNRTSDWCQLGRVKTVIGHTEGCAGLAGVLKAVLAIRNQTLPPNLLFNQLSDSVRPFDGPLQILTTTLPWPDTISGSPKRASVNSFGFSGTNAHALIEEYNPQVAERLPCRPGSWSARDLGPFGPHSTE